MNNYLLETNIIDYSDPEVFSKAKELARGCMRDVDIAEKCFIYVRDEINHTGDIQSCEITVKASDVLKAKTGWCYAKSHLLAALLRANGIPTGFCYQRLHCNEYKDGAYCLHGLNAIYLDDFGWYKVDARGNKEGVNAQFIPPKIQLAFALEEGEIDIDEIYETPLENVVNLLSQDYETMINNFPDISNY